MSAATKYAFDEYNVTLVEYVWLDVNGMPRSKNRVMQLAPGQALTIGACPIWNFDGSSTGQAKTLESEVLLRPVAVYRDPFVTAGPAYLVLCDTLEPSSGVPHATNTRAQAADLFARVTDADYWFGIEQEFFLMETGTQRPVGFPAHALHRPREQFHFYCSVGDANAVRRDLVMAAYLNALRAGVKVCGMNAEVAPGQWEIQIGPLSGIEAADDLVMLRYILHRTCEGSGVSVEFGAKPVRADYNGSGAHTNFSTRAMRSKDTGRQAIDEAIARLAATHADHLKVYGDDNVLRLTGQHETSDPGVFSSGVGARNASIRIPTQVAEQGYGYLEDRRPSSSCDPYLVLHALARTISAT